MRTIHSISLALSLLATACSSAFAGFTEGDAYVVSMSLPGAGGFATPGIYRYLPQTGEAGVWLPLPTGSFGPGTIIRASGASYDPARDRVIIPLGTGKLGLVASDGALSTIALPLIDFPLCTPGPNGIVYLISGIAIYYLDADNVAHELLAPGGAPIVLGTSGLGGPTSAIFDVGTWSMIITGTSSGGTRFARITLDPTGTQATGQPTITDRDLIPGEGEVIAGLSEGPSNTLFVSIDINANGTFQQLQTLDSSTLTSSVFATTSGFLNGGATTGAWMPTLGAGLLLDTFADVLRLYSPGSVGPGTIVGTNASSSGGSAEQARLIAIGGTINGTLPVTGDLDGDGHVGASDLAILLGAWGACVDCMNCPADLDGDCTVSAPDLSIMLGRWG
jgi:hypothetical protein